MNVVEPIFMKLVTGDTLSVKQLNIDNPEYIHTLHTIMVLGDYSQNSLLDINNLTDLKFSGGNVFNALPITYVKVSSTEEGILVIGKKQKKSIF